MTLFGYKFFLTAVNLIFSFTNGDEWDGPYKLQFQVPKMWRNKPIGFFNVVRINSAYA